MSTAYPWLSTLWQYCETIDKPCGLILSGSPQSGLDRFVISLLQEKFEIGDPTNHPDVMFIEGNDKSIGIDEMRELVRFTHIKPTLLSYKCVVIHPLEALTLAAQQAFLKTLEESLVPTYFLMLSYNVNRVLPTIKSRSQSRSMGEVSSEAILAYAKRLGLSFDEHDILIAQYAPLYHERSDYPAFKKVFSESLALCASGRPWVSKTAEWNKIAADIQLTAMSLALTCALKRDFMNQQLQHMYSSILDLSRLREKNNNINLGMHLDAIVGADYL